MKQQVIRTKDNSTTIFLEELDEHYHSTNGAVQEALHVFIRHGLKAVNKGTVKILEVGFGTGLNAFLTALSVLEDRVSVAYTGLEAFPLEPEVLAQMDFGPLWQQHRELYEKIHVAEWEKPVVIHKQFTLEKRHCRVQDFKPEPGSLDLIYFDAFGPRVQPEMWETPVFRVCYDALSENGVLVTYCAQGQMKRNLKEAGFRIEALPGPPGKREMTRAFRTV